ncbi:hypothetical protein Scep_001932 [Stephania cephalantha]|uniref:Uncharacterized protein n=1 Tax=Stephania cephalantha TaxID=152367 RepID=A0AAP0L9D4_9MAGN
MTHGLPCAHELASYQLAGSPILLDDIHKHWQKSSMNPEYPVNRTEYNFRDEIQRVIERFQSVGSEDEHMRIAQQLQEISCPSSLSLVAPKEKLKTRGRKRSKSGKRKVSQVGKKRMTPKEDEYDVF